MTAIINNAHFLRCYLRSRPSKLLHIRSQMVADRSNLCTTAQEIPRTGQIQRKPTLSAAMPSYQEMPPQISTACILREPGQPMVTRGASSPVHGRGVSLDGVRVGVRHPSEGAEVAGGGRRGREEGAVGGGCGAFLLALPPLLLPPMRVARGRRVEARPRRMTKG